MAGSLLTLAVLAAVGFLGVAVLERTIRRTAVGFGLLLASLFLDTALVTVSLQAQVGPFAVFPNDVVFGLLGVAATARLLRARRLHPLQVLVVVFLAVSVYSALRGMPLHGAGAAINEARKNLHYGSCVLYFATDLPDREQVDRFASWWLYVGVYVLGVALVRWAMFAAGLTGSLPQGDTLRVLTSFDTVVLITALVLAAAALVPEGRAPGTLSPRPPTWVELFAIASFLAIVVLQHRTLWIGLIIALVLLAARSPRLTGRLVAAVVLGGVALSVVVVAVFGQGVERIVTEDISSTARNVDTFEWRVQGWRELVETSLPEDPVEIALGQPFGGGFERSFDGHHVTVSPHNYYLESYLRVGVVGLVVFVLLHAAVAARLYLSRLRTDRLRHDALGIVVIVQMLYYLTSHPAPEHGAITGFAVAVAIAQGSSRRSGTGGRGRPVTASPSLARV